MVKVKQKTLVMFLLVVFLAILAAGCTKGTNENSPSPESTQAESSSPAASTESTTPASAAASPQYPASMTYWVTMDGEATATMKDYSEMGLFKQMEKVTGTKVTFQHPPEGGADDQFNLMMASGDLPDVIQWDWQNKGTPDKAIKSGNILRLNELIDQYAPNLSKLIKDNPEIRKQITSEEGNIYAFPNINDDPTSSVYIGPIIRKDWLDKLNLQAPTTLDEWENVLTAFRDQDPNGNGKKDEIPFLYNRDSIELSSYAFIGAYGITFDFFNDNGTVKFGPYEPQFKDFLTRMNKWYEEGLIDKDYLTTDTKIMDAEMTGNQLGSVVYWVGSGIGRYLDLMKSSNPEFELAGTRFPSLQPGGKAVAKQNNIFNGIGAAISAKAKDPEKIAAWLDYAYSNEGSNLWNFGVEGESYTMVNGKPQFTDLIFKNPKGLSASQALIQYALAGSSGPFRIDPDGQQQYAAYPEQRDAKVNWADADHTKLMPPVSLTADEQSKYASIMTDLTTYRQQMTDKFIMGAESLDKFDDYIATLKKLGIEDAIKLEQAALDRYMKK